MRTCQAAGAVLIDIRVLGPVEVWRGDIQVALVRRQQRMLLGVLAIEANKIVPVDRMITLLWDEQTPRNARAILQTRVSELRSALHDPLQDDHRLVARGGGYTLEVDPERVDVHRFRSLVLRARETASDTAARDLLHDAMALWRGSLLDGGEGDAAHLSLRDSFEAERLTAFLVGYTVFAYRVFRGKAKAGLYGH